MIRKSLPPIICVFILLLSWQCLSLWMQMPELVPSVPFLLKSLLDLFSEVLFYKSVGATILRGLAGLALSLIAATGISFIFSKKSWIYELFHPLLTIMRSVPVISFILLALIFMHAESIPLLIAFLTMFPLLTENITKGIRNQRIMFQIMGTQFHIGRWNRFTQILYPQLKPFLFSGLASAMGFGWRAIIMGEVLAQCEFGIGGEMKRAQAFIAVPQLLAWTLIAILISFAFDKIITHLQTFSFSIKYSSGKKAEYAIETYKRELSIQNLCYKYNDQSPIFSNFSYTFKTGLIYGISAPSGKGKTTLLNLMSGLLQPQNGKIITGLAPKISRIFQEPELLPQLTAIENIALPLAAIFTQKEAFCRAEQYLQLVELSELKERMPDELSYGQQQRIALARALAYPAPLLLMDEPFKGLDAALTQRIVKIIREQQQKDHKTIIFTSHNTEELQQLADIRITL